MDNNNYLRIRSKPKYFIFLCLYYLLYPICHIVYGRKKNWIICERGDDAQDNGYVFYRYLRENHPEINAIYLIKKSSPDYRKVASLGNVVEFGSKKHFLMMIGAPTKISSHLFGYSPWVQSTLYYRRHRTRHKHVFLQHGITKNDLPGFYGDVCKSIDLFICGAKPEYEYVKEHFLYPHDVVMYTGFPRFDYLNDYKTNGHILFMPTWRRYLSGLSNEQFIDSEFYNEWKALINNSTLLTICRDNDIHVDLYIHHELQRYSSLFKGNDAVNVITFGDNPVQSLLKESSILVTDFSSVFFDFAYMHKPIVFYQFDESRYNSGHYAKGYFDYRRDGFGDVVITTSDVVESLKTIVSNNFNMSDEYRERTNRFFTLDKQRNCDRVYKRILDL